MSFIYPIFFSSNLCCIPTEMVVLDSHNWEDRWTVNNWFIILSCLELFDQYYDLYLAAFQWGHIPIVLGLLSKPQLNNTNLRLGLTRLLLFTPPPLPGTLLLLETRLSCFNVKTHCFILKIWKNYFQSNQTNQIFFK